MNTYLKMLCQLIMAPTQGWADVSHEGANPRRLMTVGFLPLLIVAGLTFFLQGFYHPGIPFTYMLEEAIVIFFEYFITFFIAQAVFSEFIYR